MKMPAWVRRRTSKWNRVIDFGMNSCDAPWPVYFTSALAPAGKAIITLLSFGLDDVARGYLRPKGLYKNGCLGRKKRGRNVVGIPELGEEIGKRLPAADLAKSRSYSLGEKTIWLLDGVAQRVLFWVMVGDIVTDFAFDYMQGIYRRGFCKTQFSGQYVITGWGLRHGYPPIGDWEFFQAGKIDVDRNTFGLALMQKAVAPNLSGSASCQWTLTTTHGEIFIGKVFLTVQGFIVKGGELVQITDSVQFQDVILIDNQSITVNLNYSGPLSRVTTYCDTNALADRVHAVCDVFQFGTG